MVAPSAKVRIVLRSVELLLFGLALALAIPIVPAYDGYVYSFSSVATLGGGAFAISMLLAGRRGAENWLTGSLKLAFYLMLAYGLLLRVQIC